MTIPYSTLTIWTKKKWSGFHCAQQPIKIHSVMCNDQQLNDVNSFKLQTFQPNVDTSLCSNQLSRRKRNRGILFHKEQTIVKTLSREKIIIICGDFIAKIWKKNIMTAETGFYGLGVMNNAGQWLTDFCTENSLVNMTMMFQQPLRCLYTWMSLDGKHWNHINYVLIKNRRHAFMQWKHYQEQTVDQIINYCVWR